MLDLQLHNTQNLAAKWRNEDERHACASCKHCAGSHLSGFHCLALETALEECGLPAGRYTLESLEYICDAYECDYEQFKDNEWEYPDGYDPGEAYTDPDADYYREREHARTA